MRKRKKKETEFDILSAYPSIKNCPQTKKRK